jgi:hypothetical protein
MFVVEKVWFSIKKFQSKLQPQRLKLRQIKGRYQLFINFKSIIITTPLDQLKISDLKPKNRLTLKSNLILQFSLRPSIRIPILLNQTILLYEIDIILQFQWLILIIDSYFYASIYGLNISLVRKRPKI